MSDEIPKPKSTHPKLKPYLLGYTVRSSGDGGKRLLEQGWYCLGA